MNSTETMNYINSLMKSGKKNKTENMKKLLDLMGNPQDKLKFIHVAGTNGKGSTVAMTASVLKNAGYKTGMYVSPHIIDFRERIQINSVMISHDDLNILTEQVKKYADMLAEENIFITYFEFVTAVAFQYFLNEKCDFAVIEVGIGGRDDATNVIKNPAVSAITSLSIDHTDMLGNTIEEITGHKCGIIKENSYVVSYPAQNEKALEIIKKTAEERHSKFFMTDMKDIISDRDDSRLNITAVKYRGMVIRIPFMGMHQIYNFGTVAGIIECLRQQGVQISDENIKNGVESTRFPVRAEVLSSNPTVIVDGAHNKSGAEALKSALIALNRKVTVIMGMFADKDFKSAVEIISSAADKFIAVTPDYYRALSSSELIKYAEKFCKDCSYEENVISAYEKVLKNADCDDVIVICGSLYLASEIREYILNKK